MRTGHLATIGAVLVGAAALATATPAAADPGLVVGAVEDDLRASTLVDAQTRMTLFRLAGFRAVRVTSYWTPGLDEPTNSELEVLENVAGAAQTERCSSLCHGHAPGIEDDPAHGRGSGGVRLVRSVDRPRRPDDPTCDRRERAEPEPLLASTVRTQRLERLPGRLSRAPGACVRRIEGGVAATSRCTAERCRRVVRIDPKASRHTHSPTKFIRELGVAYRASGRTRPIMDSFAIHPYADNSSQAPTVAHPLGTTIGVADYGKLVVAPDRGVRRHGTARIDAADPVRRVRSRVADPVLQDEPLHRHRAHDHEAGRRGHAGRVLRAGAGAGVLPAQRRRDLALPRRRTSARCAGWQSGVRYVDGHLEELARTRDRGARSHDRRVDHALSRRPTRRPSLVPPLRQSWRGAARDLPHDASLQPRLHVRAARREGRRGDEDGAARARRGRRAGRDRVRVAAPRRGDVSLSAEARPPGEPGSADRSRRPGLQLP